MPRQTSATAGRSRGRGVDRQYTWVHMGIPSGQRPPLPGAVRHALITLSLDVLAPSPSQRRGAGGNVRTLLEPRLHVAARVVIFVATAGKVMGTRLWWETGWVPGRSRAPASRNRWGAGAHRSSRLRRTAGGLPLPRPTVPIRCESRAKRRRVKISPVHGRIADVPDRMRLSFRFAAPCKSLPKERPNLRGSSVVHAATIPHHG